MGRAHVAFEFPAQRVAVHLGHHDVTDDDVGRCLLSDVPSFFAVFGLSDVERTGEYRSDELSDTLVVLNNKDEAISIGQPLSGCESLSSSPREGENCLPGAFGSMRVYYGSGSLSIFF